MSQELLSVCPVCGGQHFTPYLQVQDHSVSHGTFEIVRCKNCSFQFTNPRPDEKGIGAYYDDESYISHHDNANTPLAKVYNMVRNLAVKQKINLLKKYDNSTQKRILDIGAATGFFLSASAKEKWESWGTEPDEDARKIANQKNNGTVLPTIFDLSLDGKRFSSITMWHVLEHVHQLNETLDWIYRHLDNEGALFIAVPNPESYDASVYQEYWAAYDVPRHLYHFTKTTMEKLLHRHGFYVAAINSMLFDSYYVSLLSTQYKYGKKKPVEAVLTGTMSNIKGYARKKGDKNTSSLIYIIKKSK